MVSDQCHERAKSPVGAYTLTVPTGGGKTVSSLRFALHHAKKHSLDRIIYIVPFTSIIEQNADVARQFIEREADEYPWVLEHHSNLDAETQSWYHKLISENWDAPIVFITMVQFLNTMFGGGTRYVRRLHQLSNAVLIFDEAQSLPIKCIHMFNHSINFLTQTAGSTALLCTATQPVLHKLRNSERGVLNLAEQHEIVTDHHQLETSLRRVNLADLTSTPMELPEICARVKRHAEERGNCLVIVNTKSWAKQVYESLMVDGDPDSVFHLSTSQCAAHRRVKLKEIRARLADGLPVQCVSTQLIESGVDISFATVIRFLAGLDSIAQAAGRCNRHGELSNEHAKGLVEIVSPANDGLDYLRDIKEGANITRRLLREFPTQELLSPQAIAAYFHHYYFQRADLMSYPLDNSGGDSLLELLSGNELNPGKNSTALNPTGCLPLLKQSFMDAGKAFQAIEAPTEAVLVPYGQGEEIIASLCATNKTFDPATHTRLLREAQPYCVNLYPNELARLRKADAVHETQQLEGIYYLNETHYSENYGVSTKVIDNMTLLNV